MSDAFRRAGRVALVALVVGFAPAASAVAPTGAEAADLSSRAWTQLSRAAVQAAHETAGPAAVQLWIDGAIAAHEQAEADRRAGEVVHAEAATLKSGTWVWKPELADGGPVEVVVSLAAQRAYVFRNRRLIGVSTVSTGRRGHITPTGSYPILQKKKVHFSNLYNNAPMPNMQRMTWDGVALHAGAIPGFPASHGCVRLPQEFSKLLYGATRIGSVVHVIAEEPTTSMAALSHVALMTARSGLPRIRKAEAEKRPRSYG